MPTDYDAIVVGARCAGSPTAMLLARQGHRVLVVDRASFPSDTLSTHLLHPPAMAALERWGLRERVVATGCPPIDTYSFDFGPFLISGTPRPVDGAHGGGSPSYSPRRTMLDQILVDAAAEAGAEIRERFTVEEIVVEDGAVVGIRGRLPHGGHVVERARVVIGADGHHSLVARAVRPHEYYAKPVLQVGAYSYWRDLPVDGFQTVVRPERGWAAMPTNDGLTLLVMGWPAGEGAVFRSDVEANFHATLELAPEFAARVRDATRVERFYTTGVSNFFRVPYGPGWALVGDAGYTKDPITAQGILDAFHDAERVASALDDVFAAERAFDDAMASAHAARDQHAVPMYEFTTQLATLAPPPPEVQQLLGALPGNPAGMDAFISMVAGTLSPLEFFAPEHIAGLMGAAAA